MIFTFINLNIYWISTVLLHISSSKQAIEQFIYILFPRLLLLFSFLFVCLPHRLFFSGLLSKMPAIQRNTSDANSRCGFGIYKRKRSNTNNKKNIEKYVNKCACDHVDDVFPWCTNPRQINGRAHYWAVICSFDVFACVSFSFFNDF